jgi:transcriptional regulator with XRE-family HTH domain
MSQAELAEMAYVKQSSISRIEDGTRAVSLEDVLYLSYALNKPISHFFPKEFVSGAVAGELSLLERAIAIRPRTWQGRSPQASRTGESPVGAA